MGPRIGVARYKGGNDGMSGYANSLKLGCTKCSVNDYMTTRPDGFMDVLPSEDLTVSNVSATFDSVFLNNVFPALRFPAKGYTRVKFENIVLTDTAPFSSKGAVSNLPNETNNGITFKNVKIVLNDWAGAGLPNPKIGGTSNDVTLDYVIQSQQKKLSYRLGNDGRWETKESAPE